MSMISPIWARFPADTQLLLDAVVAQRLANHVAIPVRHVGGRLG